MNLRFKSVDILPDMDGDNLNKELELMGEVRMMMFFLMDLGPAHKRLFIGYGADIPETDKNPTMQ